MFRVAARSGRHLSLKESLQQVLSKEQAFPTANPRVQATRSHFLASRSAGSPQASLVDVEVQNVKSVPSYFRWVQRRLISGSRNPGGSAESAAIPGAPASKLNFVAWYLRKLDQHPLATKSLTAGTIYVSSDLTSQGLAALTVKDGEQKVEWDKARSLRMLAVGLFMSGPLLHLWFNSVARFLPKRDLLSTLKKLVLGQAIFGPAFCAAFFSINSYAQGERGSQITQRLQRDLIPTLKNGLMYWPVCDFITYRYLPVHLQPFFSNCCSFLWTIYLTYMAGKASAPSVASAEAQMS